jgi:hypothetical protein
LINHPFFANPVSSFTKQKAMKTKEAYQQALRTYLILKNYSLVTVSAYICAFRQFLDWRADRKYGTDFTPEQARPYLR